MGVEVGKTMLLLRRGKITRNLFSLSALKGVDCARVVAPPPKLVRPPKSIPSLETMPISCVTHLFVNCVWESFPNVRKLSNLSITRKAVAFFVLLFWPVLSFHPLRGWIVESLIVSESLWILDWVWQTIKLSTTEICDRACDCRSNDCRSTRTFPHNQPSRVLKNHDCVCVFVMLFMETPSKGWERGWASICGQAIFWKFHRGQECTVGRVQGIHTTKGNQASHRSMCYSCLA